uniref:Uncharacterized protein n=1 Tax=Brassica oleracea TaxID=3712 RepID=A0A3P6CET3_BRAOL|nr:unnamed protein product [Brassica oleracea]
MMRSSTSLGLPRLPSATSVPSSGRILSPGLPLVSSTSKAGFSASRNKSPLLSEGWLLVILRSPSVPPLALASPLSLRSPGDSSRPSRNAPSIILDGLIPTELKRSSPSSRACTVSPTAAVP